MVSGTSSTLVYLIAIPLFSSAFLLLGGRALDRIGHLIGTAASAGSFAVALFELNKMLEFLSLHVENIDYFVLHQANKIINDTLRLKMKGSSEQFPESLSDYGNTSSASIPITMTAKLSGKWNQKGKKIIICGFGIGLSWATMSYISDGTELSFHEISSV